MSVNRRGIDTPVICTTSPPWLHLASAIQSHTKNFGSPAVDTQCLPRMNKHPASDRKTVTRTQPIMLQVYSRRAHIFYRGVDEDNLALYLVYNKLLRHVAFRELSTGISSLSIYAARNQNETFSSLNRLSLVRLLNVSRIGASRRVSPSSVRAGVGG